MNVHQEEDNPRLQVTSDVVDDEPFADVVNLDERSSRSLHRFVTFRVFGNSSHVIFHCFVRVPSLILFDDRTAG